MTTQEIKDIEATLPKLEGSDKQVAWATDLRWRVLTNMAETPVNPAARDCMMGLLAMPTSARWWIDNCASAQLLAPCLGRILETVPGAAEYAAKARAAQ